MALLLEIHMYKISGVKNSPAALYRFGWDTLSIIISDASAMKLIASDDDTIINVEIIIIKPRWNEIFFVSIKVYPNAMPPKNHKNILMSSFIAEVNWLFELKKPTSVAKIPIASIKRTIKKFIEFRIEENRTVKVRSIRRRTTSDIGIPKI